MMRMILEPKVEQLESTEFLGVEPAVFGTCLIVKNLSWPTHIIMYIKIKLCFCSFLLCNLFVFIQSLKGYIIHWTKLLPKCHYLACTPVCWYCMMKAQKFLRSASVSKHQPDKQMHPCHWPYQKLWCSNAAAPQFYQESFVVNQCEEGFTRCASRQVICLAYF